MRAGGAEQGSYTLPFGSDIGGLSSFMRSPDIQHTSREIVWLENGRLVARVFIC